MKKIILAGTLVALLTGVCAPAFAQDAAKSTSKKEKVQVQAVKKQAQQQAALPKQAVCPEDQYLMYNAADTGKEVVLPVTYELKAADFLKADEGAAAHWLYVYTKKKAEAPADTDGKDWAADAVKAQDFSFLPQAVTLRVYKKDDLSDEQRRALSIPAQDAKQEVRYTVLSRENKTAVLAVPVAQAKQELKGFGGAFFPPERACGDADVLKQAAPSGL